ncbi:exonuclease SbcCD subunit D [Varibaculum vaginae]|uniref:exonuclease SbcCD subunit D n=1 Tax=Varibaculum vaginae TaxID=2364797 RepID=UPI000F08A0D1|nr:exonuclease SbcCD subunit D [Varibaculum vaginae]
MKLIHTSDWHVGRTLYGEDLSAAHRQFFSFLTQLVRDEHVQAVMVSGDIFDRAIPSLESLEIVSQALTELTALTAVILTPGNHDSAERLGFLSPYVRGNLHLRTSIADISSPVEISTPSETLRIWGLPYLNPDMVRTSLYDGLFSANNPESRANIEDGDAPMQLPRSHEAVVAAAMRRVGKAQHRLRPVDRTMVMAHAFAVGGTASDSERDITVGTVQSVPLRVFESYGKPDSELSSDLSAPDYLALGHLHVPQKLHTQHSVGRYSGSPITFSFSECHTPKSVVLLETRDPNLDPQLIPTPVYRPVGRIKDSFANLISNPKYEEYTQYWLEITVTDPQRPNFMVSKLKQRFPKALAILHEVTSISWENQRQALRTNRCRPQALAKDFFRQARQGKELNEEENRLIEQVYEQVRGES